MGASDVASALIIGVVLIVFAYAVARIASFAYFRTKLEYLREAMKEMTKERK